MYCSASQWIESASSCVRHHRQRNLLDDDRIAGQRGDDVLRFEALGVENATDSVGNRHRVDDRAVDDACRAESTRCVGDDLETLDPFGFSSMALTALDPMSRPTTGFGERRKLNSNRKGRASTLEFRKAGATAAEAATDATFPRQNWDRARRAPLGSG